MSRGGKNPPYSEREDALIRACRPDDLASLAKRLGRPLKGLRIRRSRLVGETRPRSITRPRVGRPTAEKIRSPAMPRFARPAWFVENLDPRAGR